MRKSLWIMLAVLSVAIAVPSAQANTAAVSVPQADPSLTYSFSDPSTGFSFTTAPISAVTMQTTVPAADLTATSTFGLFTAGCTITSAVLDFRGLGANGANFSGSCALASAIGFDAFALANYSTPGTYTSGATGDKLVVTATPEPSSFTLMLLGVPALLIVTRKRIGQSRPSAV